MHLIALQSREVFFFPSICLGRTHHLHQSFFSHLHTNFFGSYPKGRSGGKKPICVCVCVLWSYKWCASLEPVLTSPRISFPFNPFHCITPFALGSSVQWSLLSLFLIPFAASNWVWLRSAYIFKFKASFGIEHIYLNQFGCKQIVLSNVTGVKHSSHLHKEVILCMQIMKILWMREREFFFFPSTVYVFIPFFRKSYRRRKNCVFYPQPQGILLYGRKWKEVKKKKTKQTIDADRTHSYMRKGFSAMWMNIMVNDSAQYVWTMHTSWQIHREGDHSVCIESNG